MKYKLRESQLISVFRKLIKEGVVDNLNISEFEKIKFFELKEDIQSITYVSPSILIKYFKKPIDGYYKVEFIALNIKKNDLSRQYVNFLDSKIDEKLDKETITMIETSSDWYISRTPTIENFKKFKESVTDFLEKYPIK
jgi:sugar-specific transcriptional regulator TrmB